MLPGELKMNNMAALQESLKPAEFAAAYLEKGRLDFRTMIRMEGGKPAYQHDFHLEGLDLEKTRELFDGEGYVARLANLLERRPESFGELVREDVAAFTASLRGEAKRDYTCWAAKDVGGRSARLVDLHRSMFGHGKVVFIARQPEFVVRSIINDRKRKNIMMTRRMVWHECLRAQGLINYLALQKKAPRSNDIFIHYEKLTEDTEGEMRRIAAHLEIPYEPIFCRPTALGQDVVVRTSSQKTTAVFKQESDWRKDLSSMQAATITWFFRLAPLTFKRKKQQFTSYEDYLKLT